MPTLSQLPDEILYAIAGHLEQGERVRGIPRVFISSEHCRYNNVSCVQVNLAMTCKALQPLLLSHSVCIHGSSGWKEGPCVPNPSSSPRLEATMQAFNTFVNKHANRIKDLHVVADGTRDLVWEDARPLPALQALTPAYRCLPHHPFCIA